MIAIRCCILILLFVFSLCFSVTCQKNEHQVPLTIYAFSDSPMRATSFSIADMYSTSDILYYDSENKLDNLTEFSETICIVENEQMAYRLVIHTSESLDNDLELAVFYGYGTEPSSMRIKVFVPKEQAASTIKGPFTLPHVVCTNGRQYSIFKHNTIMANQEFVYIWGTLPNSSTQKLLLSFPSISDYVSMMMDVCIPDSMTNLQLMLKSTGGSTWWKGSYVSVYDAITSSVLLTTTLSIRESMTVPFPVGIPTIPLDIQLSVPKSQDRRLVTLWGVYGGVETMVGVVYSPFPYYQHLMKRINVIKNDNDSYTLHFDNTYEVESLSLMKLVILYRDKVIGDYLSQSIDNEVFSLSAALHCVGDVYKGIQFPDTPIDSVFTVTCHDNSLAYTRRCDSFGNWEKVEGDGCSCEGVVDENGIEWREVRGNAIIQKSCGAKKEGVIQRTCSPLGVWIVNSGSCSPLFCPQVTTSEFLWERTLAGTTTTIPCKGEGVSVKRHCNDKGEWEPVIEGKCICGDVVENGLFWNHTDSNTVRQHPCGEGYTGSIVRKCGKNGMWLPIRNQCYRMKCDELNENGAVYPKAFAGDSVTIGCPSPYIGILQRSCQYNGKWGFVYDSCEPPSCDHFTIVRSNSGCVLIDVIDRYPGETAEIQILPKPTSLSSTLTVLLPASLCDLDTNQPYSLTIRRFQSSSASAEICKIDYIYNRQQCEIMNAPILRDIMYNEEGDKMMIQVMVEVPFCYDLMIHSLQVRVECSENCSNDKPLILSHVCHNPCKPGSLIAISSQPNLSSTKSYVVSVRAVPERSPIALSSQWSKSIHIDPKSPPMILQPKIMIIPKSSHSVKLQWSLNENEGNVAVSNYILHIFVSIQSERSTDPRYLNFVDSQPICHGSDICRRNSIIVPIGNNGLRYVFVIETTLMHSGQYTVKNGTAVYVVPEKPTIETTVTNYDTFANVTFFNSNMDVHLNCSILDSQKNVISQFLISVDYSERVSQIFGDLIPLSTYSVHCWIRDSFLPPYPFSLTLQMIDFVPVLATVNITRAFFQYADIAFSVNRQGSFKCLAFQTPSENYLVQVNVLMIEEFGKAVSYTRPLNTVHSLIPVKAIHVDDSFASDEDDHIYVACFFIDFHSAFSENVKMIRIKGGIPTGNYNLEVIASVPPPGFDGVYSHANMTLTFGSNYRLKVSDSYYFIIEPIEGLGSVFNPKSKDFTDDCVYDVTDQSQIICEGYTNTFRYEPLIVYSRECIQNKTKLIIPLPQLDSRIHYGIRTSLPDMLTDTLSNQSFNKRSLFYGRYFMHFTSMTSSPLIYSKLIRPESRKNVSLTDDIEVRFSGNGFGPSSHSMILQRVFGDILIKEPLDRNCSRLVVNENSTTLLILISQCVGSLEPNTNYELFISSLCWSRNSKESPNSVFYRFKTLSDVLPPSIRLIEPKPNSMITRYQNIHFQFSEPVYLGSGEVTVTVVDMLSQSIVFDEVTGKASNLLVQKANDFEVTLCVKDLPFYPYSLYKVSWGENAILSYHSISVPSNSTFFYSVDDSCKLDMPKQSVYPYFCTYYYDKSIPICHCSEVF